MTIQIADKQYSYRVAYEEADEDNIRDFVPAPVLALFPGDKAMIAWGPVETKEEVLAILVAKAPRGVYCHYTWSDRSGQLLDRDRWYAGREMPVCDPPVRQS